MIPPKKQVPSPKLSSGTDLAAENALSQVQRALTGLRFGQITVTVHEGVVVQIERLERIRF